MCRKRGIERERKRRDINKHREWWRKMRRERGRKRGREMAVREREEGG